MSSRSSKIDPKYTDLIKSRFPENYKELIEFILDADVKIPGPCANYKLKDRPECLDRCDGKVTTKENEDCVKYYNTLKYELCSQLHKLSYRTIIRRVKKLYNLKFQIAYINRFIGWKLKGKAKVYIEDENIIIEAMARAVDRFEIERGFKLSTLLGVSAINCMKKERTGKVKKRDIKLLLESDAYLGFEKEDDRKKGFEQFIKSSYISNSIDDLETYDEIAKLFSKLNDNQRYVIERVVMYNDKLYEAGKVINVSRERVRQIRDKALEILRKNVNEETLLGIK